MVEETISFSKLAMRACAEFCKKWTKKLEKITNKKLIAAFVHFNILKQMYEIANVWKWTLYAGKIHICSIRCAYLNHSVHNETSHAILYILQHC